MEQKKRATGAAPCNTKTNLPAKVMKDSDLSKVYRYFLNNVATSLECAFAVDRLRNSVTWYIDMLEQSGKLMAVRRGRDPYTGRTAKFYTADRSKWPERKPDSQLTLFNKEGGAAWE